jgi:hypothetical protein
MRGLRTLLLILILVAAAVIIFAYVRGDHHEGVSGDVRTLWQDAKRGAQQQAKDARDRAPTGTDDRSRDTTR